MFRKIILACLLALAPATGVVGEPLPLPAAGEAFWGLGTTGIQCYREPCPWHGVFPIGQDGKRGRPLSHLDQRQPPALDASEGDRARIEEAFAESGCVVAEGHFEGGTLVVRRLLGDCRGL